MVVGMSQLMVHGSVILLRMVGSVQCPQSIPGVFFFSSGLAYVAKKWASLIKPFTNNSYNCA